MTMLSIVFRVQPRDKLESDLEELGIIKSIRCTIFSLIHALSLSLVLKVSESPIYVDGENSQVAAALAIDRE